MSKTKIPARQGVLATTGCGSFGATGAVSAMIELLPVRPERHGGIPTHQEFAHRCLQNLQNASIKHLSQHAIAPPPFARLSAAAAARARRSLTQADIGRAFGNVKERLPRASLVAALCRPVRDTVQHAATLPTESRKPLRRCSHHRCRRSR